VDIPIPEVALVMSRVPMVGSAAGLEEQPVQELGQMTEEISLNPRKDKTERRGKRNESPRWVANAGQSGNGGQTTGSKPGSGSGNGYGAGAGNGAGTGQSAGVGNGKGNGNSKNAATNNAGNGGEPGSSAATPGDAKKAPPTTTSKHTTPPPPVAKSCGKRFLEWIVIGHEPSSKNAAG